MTARPDFYDHAACVRTPLVWWFPTNRDGQALDDFVPPNAALRCAACPVRPECHRHALAHEPYGVFAGTSEAQRTALRKAAGLPGFSRLLHLTKDAS